MMIVYAPHVAYPLVRGAHVIDGMNAGDAWTLGHALGGMKDALTPGQVLNQYGIECTRPAHYYTNDYRAADVEVGQRLKIDAKTYLVKATAEIDAVAPTHWLILLEELRNPDGEL